MAHPEPLTPGGPADPLTMTPAEKLACEWEARHDVIARGKLGASAPVQHYLTHLRCEEAQHHGTSSAADHPHGPRRTPADRYHSAASVRAWLRWGEDQS